MNSQFTKAALALMLALACTITVVHADSPSDPASVITAFYAAMNRGDVDAAVNLFADDARWTTLTGVTVTGREQVRGRVQNLVGRHQRFEFLVLPVNQADKVTWETKETYPDLPKLGIDADHVVGEAVVRGGKIRSFKNTRTPEAESRFRAASAAASSSLPRAGEPVEPIAVALGGGAALILLGLLLRSSFR